MRLVAYILNRFHGIGKESSPWSRSRTIRGKSQGKHQIANAMKFPISLNAATVFPKLGPDLLVNEPFYRYRVKAVN
jgi:hypothetical protein